MGSTPVLKPREVIARLERLGFVELRQRGSHKHFRHADGRVTTVPVHGGRQVVFRRDAQGNVTGFEAGNGRARGILFEKVSR